MLVDNGCMWFIFGFYLYDVFLYVLFGGDVIVYGFECVGGFDLVCVVMCLLMLGDCIVYVGCMLYVVGVNFLDWLWYVYVLNFWLL